MLKALLNVITPFFPHVRAYVISYKCTRADLRARLSRFCQFRQISARTWEELRAKEGCFISGELTLLETRVN